MWNESHEGRLHQFIYVAVGSPIPLEYPLGLGFGGRLDRHSAVLTPPSDKEPLDGPSLSPAQSVQWQHATNIPRERPRVMLSLPAQDYQLAEPVNAHQPS